MALSKQVFSAYIKQFKFKELFNDMGWNNDKTSSPIPVDDKTYTLQAVAEKSGFKILLCNPLTIPDYRTRKMIETKVTKLFQEHLIIFFDTKKTEQIWQLAVRQSGKPTKVTETRYHIDQDPELLYQRASGIFFELDEEEHITIVDVTRRMAENFQQNNEKVTKQFYDKFKKEHDSFLKFIKGISEKTDKEWYTSLMLNRLMFCYFIQKKGFLDNNKNYLRDKLNACREKKSKVKFYSFYRNFLLVLFHKGLNNPAQSRETIIEIGKIPYLNGGLFDEHELEKTHANIDIDNKAFENIFNFFDEYEWHLDTRITATGKDINPDVIGYIFEKYINDRANMGAYYTKEDITDYISKNCILPYLFDETKRNYAKAFTADSDLWLMVKQSGDTYIYDAIKKGVTLPLPKEIDEGLDTSKPNLLERRKEWNKPASAEYALPTEIWREVVDRRSRYADVKNKIDNGEITAINDFITYNLNIRQFAQDAIENTDDPEFLKAFYKALTGVTILDPTCGSGAFLFAAMNILESLYEACIQRMEAFVAEANKGKYKFFEDVLAQIKRPEHPNLQYFIYKSIILNNLYGVDIMREAVEIAKLRLFLKLVATVEADYRKPNLGLEPLPDIDFNIRSGNTLVGYAAKKEIDNLQGMFITEEIKKQIFEECDLVSRAFQRYKDVQLDGYNNKQDFTNAKTDLNNRLNKLSDNLNKILHKQHYEGIKYITWLQTHQPFHWFAEFYEIVQDNGGFDVIIGNPPYLEIRQIEYQPRELKTLGSGAVHNMCIERSLKILNNRGNISMIVPLALVCTQRMTTIQNLIENNRSTWYSNFAWRPGKLFENVNRALTIFVSNHSEVNSVFNTSYLKWSSDTRNNLFPTISNTSWNERRDTFWIPKLGHEIEENILKKVLKSDKNISFLLTKNSIHRVYYRTTGGLYWKIFTTFSPKFFVNGKEGKSSRETYFAVNEKNQDIICITLLSSNLFWWWYTVTSNLRDLNPSDIQGFKFPLTILSDSTLVKLGKEYLRDLQNNSTMLTRIQKQTGETQTQSFKISLSKPIIDEIDKVLAKHYGFTEEELDFIINYDIKYRMGKELEEEE